MSNVKNLQSLEKLLGICTGLGGSYNPGNQNLQVKAMATLLSQAQTVLSEVDTARTGFEVATNAREQAFGTLRPLTTRIISALIAGGAMPQTVADARTMSRKMYGRVMADRAPVPLEGEEKPKTKRRARGTDYSSLVAHFAKLLETVSASPRYKTNEQELMVESLKKYLANLQKHNSSVIDATVSWQEARRKRNEVFYQLDKNLYDVGQRSKQYVKSLFGFSSSEYQTVRKIRFTKPRV
ncbi:MAG TPA: hypothetical protein PK185_05965 [Cyclobacteriaceae bacterium]|jgi:hypothetical protein|nr:hypothetical protein [Cyclobacteriaceae bacterium]HRK53438.1 hypothetical protein [Cyclobacteriaceae bacterium]